jgi:diaminopimelate epimerase
MDFLNPDGSRSFCGNGSRCAVKCYIDLVQDKSELKFQASDGIHSARSIDGKIAVSMSLSESPEQKGEDLVINTGSPHYLRFSETDPGEDFQRIARKIRYSEKYKEKGINFNILIPRDDALFMRTYERGVEDETLSCGTGVTAAAIAAATHLGWNSPVKVETRGGELAVSFEKEEGNYTDIRLMGPAEYVYKGEYDLEK